MQELLEPIRVVVKARATVNLDSIHGLKHWARVEANGVRIAGRMGSDELVVRLFALFHDSQRLNDGHDPEHGPRAAALVRSLDSYLDFLSDTLGTCYDADRLDLGRVGIKPDPKYLNTEYSKVLAKLPHVRLGR